MLVVWSFGIQLHSRKCHITFADVLVFPFATVSTHFQHFRNVNAGGFGLSSNFQ